MKTIEVSESALESLKAMAKKLQEERDMLLAAMKDSRETLQRVNDQQGYSLICDTIWHTPTETLFDFMDCAIAACQESTKVLE